MRRGRFGGAHLLDAVIEDGVIIHYETESFHADQVVFESFCSFHLFEFR